MAAPYAYELRTRVMDAVASGMKIIKASQVFQVSRETIYQLKALYAAKQDVQPKCDFQRGRAAAIQDADAFKAFMEAHPDKTQKELARLYPTPVSTTTMCRTLKRFGYSYKKKHFMRLSEMKPTVKSSK